MEAYNNILIFRHIYGTIIKFLNAQDEYKCNMAGEGIVEEAFRLMYPERDFPYSASIKYTDHFNDYGANVRFRGNVLEFGLSRSWRNVSKEIRIGLFQELMLKIFARRKMEMRGMNTMHIDLYNGFVKNLHIAIPKTNIEPLLKGSFDRVNERYFYGQVEIPNLVWGEHSTTSLGSYNFKIDTIRISRVFEKLNEKDPELLDFVMYHEVLHKAHKFRNNRGKNRYHDSAFRMKEKQFEDFEGVDTRLKNALKRARIKKILWFS